VLTLLRSRLSLSLTDKLKNSVEALSGKSARAG
jgi:hypothetical protein